jgi:hypothetical protein
MFLDHVSRPMRGRSRALSRPLVLAGVAALALTPLAIAVPAGAAAASTPPVVNLLTGNASFHVAGHSWLMSVLAFSGNTNIDLSTTHEGDIWSFNVPAADFKTNARTGTATLNAHNAMAPVAFANLRFSPSSSHTTFDGKVTGSISLVANHRGLKFKSAHVIFKGSALTVDRQCTTRPGPAFCFPGNWVANEATSASGNTGGLPGRQTYFVSLTKSVSLTAPKNASVAYTIVGAVSKPIFNGKTRRLSVKATSVVRGSAVLTAKGPPTVSTMRCTIGRGHFKERDATYFGSYKSPVGGQFRARSLVAGLIKVARSGIASFDIVTVKKA